MAAHQQNVLAGLGKKTGWWCACGLLLMLVLLSPDVLAKSPPSVFDDDVFQEPFAQDYAAAPTQKQTGEYTNELTDDCAACRPGAADFDQWENILETDRVPWNDPNLKPFDWVRHFGFRHSSTHGRHVGRGLPLEGSSWKNRPYHVDWFSGPLLGGDLIADQVAQDNELFGGVRIGWDFDYYWGLEARFGWANPNIQFNEPQPTADNGSYFVSDIDFVYYPWGDSKVRPYLLLGAGLARVDFVDEADVNYNTTLLSTPFGGGVQFRQSSWLAWRLEILDNLAWGASGVDTMNNFSLTAGMEFRFGARPASYWPWRSSRKIW